MAFSKFQENQFRMDGEIAANYAILPMFLVNLTENIDPNTLIVIPEYGNSLA